MKILFNTSKLQYNPEVVRAIEMESRYNAKAAYNRNTEIAPKTMATYITHEAYRIENIIKRYAVKCIRTIQYTNGLFAYAYLDHQGRLVLDDLSPAIEPRFGLVAEDPPSQE